ncbi:MAG TPA: Gfo/Idh/MocA family oxidoreductase [Blastocatellia bacterium]|nr:Gfo/Idh/MocA family oxidoreductase [Blastocatellia bacterium]
MAEKKSRREFLKEAGATAAAVSAGGALLPEMTAAQSKPAPTFATGRVLGANDRINVGFVGCGGRMGSHIRHIVARSKEKGDVQAVAVNDIYEKRKQQAREMTGVDEKSVHHDYRELCARPDVDVVVISSPDHWHHLHAMAALKQGKDVYLEKPMTYTIAEAKEIADAVRASRRILQVGSQYTSMEHFWKAKQAIKDGLIGQVVWASGGFGRNRNKNGEWNYRIDPDASPKNLDWKAFLGPAPKRPFDAERYFRWRKYWDYSGGIATDLFYHTISPLLLAIGPQFPERVMASGGIYVQKDREVPDTFFMNVDYPSFTIQLACSVASGVGAPLVIHGSEGTIMVAEDSERLSNTTIQVIPDREYAEEFKKKTGKEKLEIEVKPPARGTHPHMDNFLEAVRSRQEPNFPADLGYKAMAAIRMGVDAYRKHDVFFFDARRERVSPRPVVRG